MLDCGIHEQIQLGHRASLGARTANAEM